MTQLYRDNCASCHGDRGQGGSAKTLLTRELFDQNLDKRFFDKIKNGIPDMGMVAFGGTLTDEQIWGLVVHIRELQARALREQFGSPKAVNGVYTSKYHRFKLEDVVEGSGLRTPWAIDWLPDGKALITNRPGTIQVLDKGQLSPPIEGVPESMELGQGGMMEVAVHPDYAKNGWIYLGYSEPAKDGGRKALTKIVRGKLKFSGPQATWGDQQTIWEGDQQFYTGAGVHFGVRIAFDGKGKVYFAIGERGGNMLAQELTNPFGKIYRLNEDGTVPKDNPFATSSQPGIWSYGHRNPQGLVVLQNGEVWLTEHGPRGGDEVNQVVRGANYGWPVVAFSTNYDDSPFRTPWPKAGQNFKMPAFRWLPSIGACGLDFGRGNAFPRWKGDLLAGGLSGNNVDRIRVKDGKLVEREELLHGMGRVRDVAVGPDGFVYIVLNGPDKVFRMVPAP